MVGKQSLLASLDQLERGRSLEFEQTPPAELLAEYRDLYSEMNRQRRARAFSTHDPLYRADRERAATERRVMTMASAAHRRSRAVSVDLHEARDRGPAAVIEALELAIQRHDAQAESGSTRLFSNRRIFWLAAAGTSALFLAAVAVAQLI